MNYFKKIALAIAFTAGIGTAGWSQIAMTRSTFTAAYTPISVGSGATLSTISGDDGTQTLIPIGFTFNYLGTNYTTVDACSNGWLSFGAGGANSWTNSNLWVGTNPNNTVAPWWDDLNVGTGSVLYQTQGTVGSQTFTMQWTDVLTYNGSASGRTINFQVILYEVTNVIEFRYSQAPLAGTLNTNESASIGLENGTGGPGNFLDAVSGSAFVNNSYMTTHKWPTFFYRFTPGFPTVLPGGTYTVGSTGTYPNISEAVAEINHRGISGPVTLSLVDAVYDSTVAGGRNIFPIMFGPVAGNSAVNTITMQPAAGTATLNYRGTVSGSGGTQGSTTAFSTTSEPTVAVIGTDYVTLRNLNIMSPANGLSDRGLLVSNNSATDGATNGLYENITITMNRGNASSIAINQATTSAATAVSGANSNNIYRNLNVSNSYFGILLSGTAAFPDLNCVIGTSSPTAFNTIGGATANDIGNGGTATYGIRCTNQSDVTVHNNEIRNISANGTVTCDGIFLELSQGNTNCYMNKVHDLRNNSTSATNNVQGIRANVATTGTHTVYVYNNFIYGLTSAYTGTGSATRQLKGIYLQSGGGGVATCSINCDNNNILVDGTTSPNISSTCIEIGTTSGPVINVRNNVFVNATATQTAPASHYGAVSTATSALGNTGSVWNYNDYYITNATQGFVGNGNATNHITLLDWQTAMTGQEANAVSTDPGYINASDLHVTSASIDNLGSTLAWVSADIDNQVRGGTPDIGADEFAASTLDVGASVLVAPVAGACYTSTEGVTIRVRNFSANTINFATDPVTVTVNVTGAITTTLNFTINTGTLASASTADYAIGTINMSAAGAYIFNAFTTLSGDLIPANDAMTQVTINYQPGTFSPNPSSLCQGSSTVLNLTGNTSTNIQWQESTDGGVTWVNIPGATTAPYTHTPTDTILVRSVMCGSLFSTVDTVLYFPTVSPVTVGDTICGVDTALLSASGIGTLSWYTTMSGGASVNTGTTYSTYVATTTTYYVESVNGGGIQSVGLFDNSGGGGQQTSTAYNTFDVTASATLQGAYVYPGAAGNIVCDLLDNTGTLITSRTVAVSAADIGQRTYVALNIPLSPGTGYRLAQGPGSVSMFRNSAGVAYPYTLPGYVAITGSSAGGTFYYFFYDWQVLTGCSSARTPVTATVIPTAAVTVSANNSTLCAGDSATLTATSTNLGYTYTWTPSASLNSPTGAVVVATPSANETYIVTADSAGCVAMDTLSIMVNALPNGSLTVQDTLICIGQTDSLIAIYPTGGSMTNNTQVNVPDANPVGATSTIAIPFSSIISAGSNMTVSFNMTHTWDGDMSFTLISPLGTTFDLCSNNGGSGDNFTGVVFNMSAAANITTGVAPFTGTWIPEGAGGFSTFNGENTQGTWTLLMVDGAGGDVGLLLDWTISFDVATSVSWTSNPVGFTSLNDTIVVSPAVTTDYILAVYDSSTGCSRYITQTVVVNPPLTLSVNADTTICSGDTIMITAAGNGGDGNISYSWSTGDTTTSVLVSPTALTSYVVTINDGCTTPTASDTITVDLGTPVAIAAVSNDTTLCSASPVVLSVLTSGGLGSTTYSWSNGPTTALDTVTSGLPGNSATYSVMVMDACGTTAADSVTVTAFGAPVAMVMNADTSLCMGDSIVGMAMGSGGDGNISYQWNNGPATALDSITAMASATYVVTVTDGCGNTALDSFSVTVFTAPSVIASNDTAVCFPNYAYLSSTANGGDGNYQYQWSSGAMTSTDSVALFGTMMQYITVTDGCGNTSTDSVLVTVNMMPTAIFTESTSGSTVTFTDGSMNATAWQWNFGDSQTSNQQNPSHTYTANGSYTVTLIVSNSCGSDTITSIVLIDVGINDPIALNGVNVYPNPASEVFNVSFGIAIGGQVSIEMFDAQGKLVTAKNAENIVAGQVVALDVTTVETGIYFLKITGENASRVYKLNVQH